MSLAIKSLLKKLQLTTTKTVKRTNIPFLNPEIGQFMVPPSNGTLHHKNKKILKIVLREPILKDIQLKTIPITSYIKNRRAIIKALMIK